MRKPLQGLIVAAALGLAASTTLAGPVTQLKGDETLVFYPAFLAWDGAGQRWEGEIHGNIHEPADGATAELRLDALQALLEVSGSLSPEEERHLRDRAREFLVDHERGKTIVVRVGTRVFQSTPSRPNGDFSIDVALDDGKISDTPAYEAILREDDPRTFGGTLRLIAPAGVSVISDIDDTVKDSNVTDRSELLANTFLRPYRTIEGMAEVYDAWNRQGVAIHFLTGSPWQLYPALWRFLKNSGFPGVEIQMREFRVTGSSGIRYFTSPEGYKTERLREMLARFPERMFVLVGDSGEKDPVVYAEVAKEFPDQVRGVFIRAVSEKHADRDAYREVFAGIDDTEWLIFRDSGALPRDLSAWIASRREGKDHGEVIGPSVPASPRIP
jgi:phosphatidate phosphatase APP1